MLASAVGIYDSLRICPVVGARFVTVQFDGMGTIAGPPARIAGTGDGKAFVRGSMLVAKSSMLCDSKNAILRSLEMNSWASFFHSCLRIGILVFEAALFATWGSVDDVAPTLPATLLCNDPLNARVL